MIQLSFKSAPIMNLNETQHKKFNSFMKQSRDETIMQYALKALLRNHMLNRRKTMSDLYQDESTSAPLKKPL